MQPLHLHNARAKMRTTSFFLIGVTAVLAGCALPLYAPPQDGKTATLHMLKRPEFKTFAQVYKEAEECVDPLWDGRQVDYSNSPVVISAGKPVSIRMGEDRFIFMSGPYPMTLCLPIITFTPQEGKAYFAKIETRDKACYIELTEVTQSGNVLVPHVQRRPIRSLRNAFCEPQ